MNSRERFITAARMGKPDKVPVAPYIGNYAASIVGTPISEYNTNARKMAEAQIAVWEIFKHDWVVAQSDQYYIAEGYGVVSEQPYNSTPHLKKPAIEELSEVEKLKVPNPYKDGRMPVVLEAVNILRNTFKGEIVVRGPGCGPFSMAAHTMGTEKFLMELAMAEAEEDIDKQKAIFELMEFTSDCLIAFQKAVLEAGSDIATCGDSLASLDVISPAMYEKYVFPYEKKVFDAINPVCKKYDAVSLLHICGNTTKILPLICQTGTNILECDYKVNLKEAKRIVNGQICLAGNVDPSSVLLAGTPDEIRNASIKCIEDTGENGGFILDSGCEVAMYTPIENMKAMIEAARNYNY